MACNCGRAKVLAVQPKKIVKNPTPVPSPQDRNINRVTRRIIRRTAR